ncbi:MAG: hypothetical protein AAB966_04350, partial [Patescibacteria group bacterium]
MHPSPSFEVSKNQSLKTGAGLRLLSKAPKHLSMFGVSVRTSATAKQWKHKSNSNIEIRDKRLSQVVPAK